jgi:predicted MFS family arabinose efflux permease
MAFAGLGAVAGALVVAWLGKRGQMGRILLIALALLGAAMMGFALSRTIVVAASFLFIAALFLVVCSALTTSLAQLLAPPGLRGRVVSIYLVAFMGGAPLGSLVSGWLITRVDSTTMMLMVNGAALVALASYCLIRGHDLKGT